MRLPVENWSTWYDANPFGNPQDYGFHDGSDLNKITGGNTDEGEPIYAIADGICTSVHLHTTSNNYGKHLHIQHDGPWGRVWSHYAHCSTILVSEGEQIQEGELIARVGRTGTKYSHLHFAIKLQPTGIDGIARTKEQLKQWTDPIAFINKWKGVTPPMSEELLKYLDVPNEAEAKKKLKEHLGETNGKSDWGFDEGDRGGHLGSARRRIKQLEAQPAPPTTSPDSPPIITGWKPNGLVIHVGDKDWNYEKQ